MTEADRRPIAARELGLSRRAAAALSRAGVSPNTISILGMVAGIAAGAALFATSRVPPPWEPAAWIAAALLVQLRLLANMLDGMVAFESGRTSKVGELYNEVPDRISDTAALVGLGYASGGDIVLGYGAALAAMFTAYLRTTGKAAGARQEFCGPMAKQQRMFLVTILALYVGLTPRAWQPLPPAPALLAIIIVGSIVTSIRRLRRVASTLRSGS